jgi:hypothetical protein
VTVGEQRIVLVSVALEHDVSRDSSNALNAQLAPGQNDRNGSKPAFQFGYRASGFGHQHRARIGRLSRRVILGRPDDNVAEWPARAMFAEIVRMTDRYEHLRLPGLRKL